MVAFSDWSTYSLMRISSPARIASGCNPTRLAQRIARFIKGRKEDYRGLRFMSEGIWAALIGVAGSILGSLTAWLLTLPAAVRNDAYDKVTGTIDEPSPNQSVAKTFLCSGIVTGLQPGSGLWLVVEVGDRMWPRENRPVPGADNKWAVRVFEDGRSKIVSVSLFVADSKASKRIEKWLEIGRTTGEYPEQFGLPGARRIARVDGIQIV
jgi:hypothetical protein